MDKLFPIIPIVAGIFFLIRNIMMLEDEDKLVKYLETSPKGKMWVKKNGIEKTIEMSKKTFIPLGIIVSLIMIGVGVYSLFV